MATRHGLTGFGRGLAVWTCGLVLAALVCAGPGWAGTTSRISVTTSGGQSNGPSTSCSVSADGRYVAFVSYASNLVLFDTNGGPDVFVRDRTTGETSRVSIPAGGGFANDYNYDCDISADGRYVVFMSAATNMVAGDTNGFVDVFVRDRLGGTTTRVSVASDGTEADNYCYDCCISGNGRYVAFYSPASNLVAGDTNGREDIFVHDLQSGTTTRASVASNGSQSNDSSFDPALSSDGRYVSFMSYASNLVAEDTEGQADIFVRDCVEGTTVRASLSSAGAEANSTSRFATISANGRFVTFSSYASNLVNNDTNGDEDVFVHDLVTGATSRASVGADGVQANWDSRFPAISADGRYVSFSSEASNLSTGDSNDFDDVFVRDRFEGTTVSASLATGGGVGNGPSADSFAPALSDDGRYVAFVSSANNLVTGDTNGADDIFIYDRGAPPPTVAAFGPKGTTVGPTANINITFSDIMARPTAQNAMTINGVSASVFGGTFSWLGRKMTFNPTHDLQPGTTYTIIVAKRARTRAGVNMARGFVWTFTTRAATAATVTVASAPTALGAQLTVSLGAAADVGVSIRNLAGREVAVLRPGQMAAGVHSLVWDGKSKTGTKTPAGVYLVEVVARSKDGGCAKAVTTLRR
ncbi:MAG: Ig-like domain-containing protein [Armatimonadota bacterium]